jgi:hypothetical protein
MQRLDMYRRLKPNLKLKRFLEVVCYLPAALLEPVLRRVHIRHTFKLPENHWKTSSTVANKSMLKLHALDPRKDLRKQFFDKLREYQ